MVVAGPSVVCFSLCVISLITLMKDSLSFIVLESKLNTVCKIVGVFFFRPIKLIIKMSTCKNILLFTFIIFGLSLIPHYSIGNNVTEKTFDVIYDFGLVFCIRLKFGKFFQTLRNILRKYKR